ncbi:hypothetical protein FDB23_02085 [Clostridium botulinum]|nr:hypothetical protein [Clostridium botulinum]NFO02913.1 hypothetical protein [Clostridium botulinum]NFR13348.1 hypothetical protein [Clostridium botulinum]NFR43394.1 hypothetical protein [Clostridium botulinum]NFS49332.1 hypothetical protein [Clostridium botulinum]
MIKNKTKILILILAATIIIIPSSAFASTNNIKVSVDKVDLLHENNNGQVATSENNNEENYSYEAMINEYSFLSKNEKDILINTNKQEEDIYSKIDKIYEENEILSSENKSKIIAYEKEIYNLQKNTKNINKKICIYNNNELIDSYVSLSKDEKNLLLETYNQFDDIYEKRNDLFNGHTFDELNLQEEGKLKEYDDKINVLESKIKNIRQKINIETNEKMVKEYTFLTQEERDKLLNAYNEIDCINLKIDELYSLNLQENNQSSKELIELQDRINNIRNSIKELNKKLRIHSDKEVVENYTHLTSTEKDTLLKMYNDVYEIQDKLDSIYNGKEELSTEEQKEADKLNSKIDSLYEKIYTLEEKIIN